MLFTAVTTHTGFCAAMRCLSRIGWLRLVGGQQGFALAGEVGAEEQFGNLALNARVSLRIGF